MSFLNNKKKAQGLPLNAIVLAILVIIVLLVIILFFTGKMGSFGNKIDNQGKVLGDCSMGNAIIVQQGYKSVDNSQQNGCKSGYSPIIGITTSSKGYTCCGIKTTSSNTPQVANSNTQQASPSNP